MQNKSINGSSSSFISRFQWKHVLELAVPLTFFLLMFFFFPFRERFEFDTDEGINAIKGLMLVRGYPLYTEIWSDQPPLFTYLIAPIIRVSGNDINALRTLVLLFSTILLGSSYFFLRLTWGIWHALAGVLILLLLPFYKTLSVSVMIGLPAIAFAGLSLLTLTLWHQRHNNIWLVLSATTLSLSILTKLFTGFLAPIFVAGILIDQKNRLGDTRTWFKLMKPAIIWSLVFVGITLGLGLTLVGPANLDQLLGIQLAARNVELYTSITKTYTISWWLRESWAILLLALVGSIFTLLNRNRLSLYPVAWVVTGYLLLSFHIPVWSHQQLLVTIPAAMLAGVAVGEATHQIPHIFHTRNYLSIHGLLLVTVIVSFLLALIRLVPLSYLEFSNPVHLLESERILLVRMNNHAPLTQWIVTDVPMYAFRIGKSVPPPLAVFSGKRLDTGYLTEAQIIEGIRQYQPEQIVFGRFTYPTVEQYLKDKYQLIYSQERMRVYIKKGIKK